MNIQQGREHCEKLRRLMRRIAEGESARVRAQHFEIRIGGKVLRIDADSRITIDLSADGPIEVNRVDIPRRATVDNGD